MKRQTEKAYSLQMLALGTIYIVFMLFEWPYARSVSDMPLKVVLALAPVLPMLAVMWLMARRVLHSDELQQRLHLMALSAATSAVAVLSLVGGFLVSSGALQFGGDILIWVFPALCLSYSLAYWLFGRRYGGGGCG